jgi:asparagine synthase (glutamine-hydrolysing)
MLADQVTYMCDDILVKVDRNSMWHSLEARVPLLDHRIVEFANSLPLNVKFHNEMQKYPLKQVLKDLVPAEILTRKKSGFAMPIKHWLKDRFYDYSRDLLLSSATRSTDFFDRNSLEKLIADNKLGKRDLSRRLWALMWFEQWYRHIGST